MSPDGKLTKEERLKIIEDKIANAKKQRRKFKRISGGDSCKARVASASVVMLEKELQNLGAEYRRLQRMKEGI